MFLFDAMLIFTIIAVLYFAYNAGKDKGGDKKDE